MNGHDSSVCVTPENGVKSEPATTPKINAFQFMMDSRNRVIGRNSPGKEIDIEETPSSAKKADLKARKKSLEEWADAKGASKRKREDEEKAKTVDYKLEKRARNLRNMLNLRCSDDEGVATKGKRRCLQIEADSDDDYMINGEKENKRKNRLSLNKSKTEENSKNVKRKRGRPRKVDAPLVINDTHNDSTEIIAEDKIAENAKEEVDKIEDDTISGIDTRKMLLRTRKQKPKALEEYCLSSESEDEKQKAKKKGRNRIKKNGNTSLKVAPVFLKAIPKPKLDPEVAEARRQFLLSGMPSSLKKELNKQQSNEEIDFDVFPVISHVQQKTDDQFWNLPKVELNLTENEPTKITIYPFPFSALQKQSIKCDYPVFHKVKNVKKIIHEIKSDNPNYPVFKIFKSLYKKSGYKTESDDANTKIQPKRRGRKKKNCVSEIAKPAKTTQIANSTWTEKYKPETSSDIFGNGRSVSALKDWLTKWMDSKAKKNYDSESEFEATSGDSLKPRGNTLILKGPAGSGKTAAVYAVCNELGFSVLEVNASSKRTGKWLLQELQEATQSHQVREKERLSSMFKQQEDVSKSKICVLLIEDVDVVFEQDEGFAAALSQLVTTSKRPIILTTSDETANLKILNNHCSITFAALSTLAVWLQIVCLIEGCYVNLNSLEELLRYNKGDIRRTLLQLQFWVTSGGQLEENENAIAQVRLIESEVETEEDSNSSDFRADEADEDVRLHHDCLSSFEPVMKYNSFTLPHSNNFETIWWNTPHIFNMHVEAENKSLEKQKLDALSSFYESLSLLDTIRKPINFSESFAKPKSLAKLKDSLGLDENMSLYKNETITNDLARTLLSGRIQIYKDKFESAFAGLKLAVPSSHEKRWRSKQMFCEEKLEEALLQADCLRRKPIVLDYMPCLRTISRSECEREENNTKRGNRFYNYLRSLGVSAGESTYRTACNIFFVNKL